MSEVILRNHPFTSLDRYILTFSPKIIVISLLFFLKIYDFQLRVFSVSLREMKVNGQNKSNFKNKINMFQGNDVNEERDPSNGESLEITSTVP